MTVATMNTAATKGTKALATKHATITKRFCWVALVIFVADSFVSSVAR